MHKYGLRYDLATETQPGGYDKSEAGDKGLCDALLVFSIITPEDGSYSQGLLTFHGKEERVLTQEEIFKAWLLLGFSLHDKGELKGWKAQLVEAHTSTVRESFMQSKDCTINK